MCTLVVEVGARASAPARSVLLRRWSTWCSVLAGLHDAVVNNVVDDSAVCIDSGKHYSLGRPPRVCRAVLCRSGCLGRRRNHVDCVKDARQPAQCPLLVEARGQHPLALRLCFDVEASVVGGGLCCLRSLALAVCSLEQLDLLVGVYVEAVWRQARDKRAWQRRIGEGRVGVDAEGGPVVLVLEVVLDLKGERLQTRQVRGTGQLLRISDEGLQRGWRNCRFGAGERRHGREVRGQCQR
jgi:hypothetical protein